MYINYSLIRLNIVILFIIFIIGVDIIGEYERMNVFLYDLFKLYNLFFMLIGWIWISVIIWVRIKVRESLWY